MIPRGILKAPKTVPVSGKAEESLTSTTTKSPELCLSIPSDGDIFSTTEFSSLEEFVVVSS